MKEIRLQAHRGVASDFPENTKSAFEAAVNEGYKIIELDPKYTKDNVCVLLHDRTINRTARKSNGESVDVEKKIAEISFEEASSYDYGLWMGEKFKGEKLMTLDELLEFMARNNIHVKFDNVWQSFTDEQQKDFLTKLRDSALGSKIGITCSDVDFLKKALDVIGGECEVHWDGKLDEELMKEVTSIANGRRTTFWACFDNPNTAWFTGEKASIALCERVKKYGELGVWILTKEDELWVAVNEFDADAIETIGTIKPCMIKEKG